VGSFLSTISVLHHFESEKARRALLGHFRRFKHCLNPITVKRRSVWRSFAVQEKIFPAV
jgi:hypothetical protein